jgi:putative ribosome biogenesis GTPase RsgA
LDRQVGRRERIDDVAAAQHHRSAIVRRERHRARGGHRRSRVSPHALTTPPNPRRRRELVLAFESGAGPVVVLTKADLADVETTCGVSLK